MRPPLASTRMFDNASTDAGRWAYWRPARFGLVEIGAVFGRQVALPTHFHDDDQLAFVLSGQRSFVVNGKVLRAGPGQAIHIPAGTAHRSLAESVDVTCINFYLAPGCFELRALVHSLAAMWQRSGASIDWSSLPALAEAYRRGADEITARVDAPARDWPAAQPSVQQAALAAGISREAYSRRFRRLHGVPPETHSLLLRLNEARRGLRAGEPIALVAADAGFADQSHLGRMFRRLFGVTPGRYRAG
jgi:AraC-like DNA-binding protein